MTLLDAYALIAFIVGGPATVQVRAMLREGDCAVATANLVEALDVVGRRHRVPLERIAELIDPLFEAGVLTSVALDAPLARRAAEVRIEHYHRRERPISLADAILIATAAPADTVATADPDVLAIARSEGIATVALPGQG